MENKNAEQDSLIGVQARNVYHITIYNLTKEEFEEFTRYIREKANGKGYLAVRQLLELAKEAEIREKVKKELEQEQKDKEVNE